MTPDAPSSLSRRAILLGGSSMALAAIVGCTSTGSSTRATEDSATPTATPTAPPTQAAPLTTVATSVVASLPVHAEPEDPDDPDPTRAGEQQRVLERSDEASGDVVMVALETGSAWLKVQLPIRPNGTTGWVRARDVRVNGHSFAMEISLNAHELVVTERGEEVLRTDVGVGRTDRPTPGGDYYVKELLAPPDPTGVYGPYAYGLSGYSTVLTEFNGGEGVIGVHGTNEPGLVGTDVSSGCIRLPNDVITSLVEDIRLPLGTPVTILA